MIRPEIGLSDKYLDLFVETGTSLEGSFTIYSRNGQELSGKVLSTNHRVIPVHTEILGKECTISYSFCGEKSAPGEEEEGEFILLTNGGEYNIPYHVTVTRRKFRQGKIVLGDLKDFYALAKSDWKKAKDIFFTKAFAEILLEDREESAALYNDLLKGFSKDAILDQFLTKTGKKKPAFLIPQKDTVAVDETKVGRLILKMEGWGFIEGRIFGASGNLYVNRERISSSDFENGQLELFLSFKNEADKDTLMIDTPFSRISIPVYQEIKKTEGASLGDKKNREISALLRHLVDFRTGKTEMEDFIANSMKELPRKGLFYELYCLFLLVLRYHYTSAGKEECDEYGRKIEEKEPFYLTEEGLESFYYYVMSLWKKDNGYAKQASKKVRKRYDKTKEMKDYLILLTMDESLAFHYEAQWEELLWHLNEGANSPMLFLTMLDVLNQEPYLLEQLNDHKAAVIRWGLRHQYLSQKLMEQFARLAIREKCFKKNQFSILQIIYDKKPDDLYLKAICSMLMKGNKKDLKYHSYFEDAVKKHLNLIGLNEFYLRSLDFNTYPVLPKLILYYFHYSNSLDRKERAWLYLNILRNKDVYEDIYDNYAQRIEEFVTNQLMEGKMNRYLKQLYEMLLPELLSDPELIKYLPNIIFKKRLTCHHPMMEGVYVCHPENEEEVHVSLIEGVCQIEIYSRNTKLYFADWMGNRYCSGIDYNLESYLDENKYKRFCLEHTRDDRRVYVKWVLPELKEEEPDRLLEEKDDSVNWTMPDGKQEDQLALAHKMFVYRKHNKEMLVYLREYFEGRLFDLFDLWDKLKKESLSTIKFEKKVLKQWIDTGSEDEKILSFLPDYLGKEDKENLSETIVEVYSSTYLRQALNQDSSKSMPSEFFEILDLLAEKNCLNRMKNQLAYLMYKSAGYKENDKTLIRNMVRNLCRQEIVFPFFKGFEPIVAIPCLYKESVIFWFEGEEKNQYKLSVQLGNAENSRETILFLNEIAPGLYYGNLYLPAYEKVQKLNVEDDNGKVSFAPMGKYMPGSRSDLLAKMEENKSTAGMWMTDYNKIMVRMKEQLRFLSDR